MSVTAAAMALVVAAGSRAALAAVRVINSRERMRTSRMSIAVTDVMMSWNANNEIVGCFERGRDIAGLTPDPFATAPRRSGDRIPSPHREMRLHFCE